MKLFIAEKPDLAKAIGAGIDGSEERFEGGFIKGDNIITWAFGHILELYEPQDYDEKLKSWNLELLPLQISEFKYKPIQSSKKQLKIICDLIKDKRVSEIIHCGDADEEGQILIDEILNYSKTTKPVYRLMLQDLTEKGVRASLKNIRPNSEFKGLSECGFARSQADWIVGLNLTRGYTKAAELKGAKGVLSIGRVQTPILGLIVNRDLEHEAHKPSFYYTIKAEISTQNTQISMLYKSDEKIESEEIANSIKSKVKGKTGTITKATHENKKEFAPLPYNLLLLQADCAKKFGYKPDKTLEITQNLREKHKCITYNRSDCQYLPENLFEQCPDILSSVKSNLSEFANLIDSADTSIKHSAFNDKNITAHYAIIPTATKVSNLSKEEQNVYELIAKRFIAIFYPPQTFIATSIEASIEGEIFVAKSKKITNQGYKVVFGADESDEKIDESEVKSDLSHIQANQNATCNDVAITKQQTKPKPYYTMATLLKDLTGVAKYVKDERIKKLLQEKDKDKKGENGGIGTPATRSEHIKKLFDRGFIEEKSKSIISTKLGRDFFSLAPQILTSPDMTALWFEEQKEIASGTKSKEQFLSEVNSVIKREIEKLKQGIDMSALTGNTPLCPKCGNVLIRHEAKNKKGSFWWGCSNYKNCDIGFINDNNGKPDFSPKPKQEQKPQQTIGMKCPKCGKGELVKFDGISKKTGKPYTMFSCTEWKQGCDFKCFPDENGKPKI